MVLQNALKRAGGQLRRVAHAWGCLSSGYWDGRMAVMLAPPWEVKRGALAVDELSPFYWVGAYTGAARACHQGYLQAHEIVVTPGDVARTELAYVARTELA